MKLKYFRPVLEQWLKDNQVDGSITKFNEDTIVVRMNSYPALRKLAKATIKAILTRDTLRYILVNIQGFNIRFNYSVKK